MDSWNEISFTVDLIETAKKQLLFIKKIDRLGNLYEGVYFLRALYRYEYIWLPLLQKIKDDNQLVPPIDVKWIWYLHLLSPTNYDAYTKSISCIMNINEKENELQYQHSKEIWESFSPAVPYDYMKDASRPENIESKIGYDFAIASSKAKNFIYQVSLPHFENEDFLATGVIRYKKFLFFKKMNPNMLIVPCYLINIIWRSHQLHPIEYKNDTEQLFGMLLPYDGTIKDRCSGPILDDMTKQLWKVVSK